MKYFFVSLALVAAFACIAESKPAEAEHELAEVEEENELADLEDAEWLEDLADLEDLEDLSDLEEARSWDSIWKSAKNKMDKIMRQKVAKWMAKKEGKSVEEVQAKVDAMSKKDIRLHVISHYGKKAFEQLSKSLE
nr:Cytoinsectotoxin-2a precursor [Lachesana tarabaevi]